jgi:fumarate hydratase class II
MNYREELDSMGTVRVPVDAYYGSQTRRAADNFPRSGLKFPEAFLHTLARIKGCAAKVNADLGLLDQRLAEAVAAAAREAAEGRFDDQFIVDVFQTGSGTSTHMNMNEVLASRANEILTGKRGGRSPVHPNDHVNLGQSSNDVIPTVIHAAAALGLRNRLMPALDHLHQVLLRKEADFAQVYKIGRTHLQDAVPLTLGQEFSGYARQVELGLARLEACMPRLCELALGGTAVGTGLNTHPRFAALVIHQLAGETGIPFVEARNHFEAQAARDAALELSGALKTVATSLVKIANDIRWLGSGPRCGIGEIILPALQPGSSIMPGKVNPVIAESVIQIAYQVMGNDTAILLGAQAGNFELNACLPLIAYNLLQSIELVAQAAAVFADKCVCGLEANHKRCESLIEESLALVTGLVPEIGYDKAAAIAKEAHASGRTIRQVVLAEKLLPEDVVDALLSVKPRQKD